MKLKFLEIEISVKSKLNHTFSTLNRCRCRKEPVLEFEKKFNEEVQDVSTQFSQTQKNQLLICRTFFQSLASTAQKTT